jgi:ketosteroid isomerase-like protein
MASENIEVVKAGFDALSEGGVEAMLPFIHEDFEVTTTPDLAAEPDTYRGHDGIRRYFDSFYEVMDEIRFEPHEYHEVGDRVLVEVTLRARGKATGLEVEQHLFQVWSLKDEKGIKIEVFPTMEEAMAEVRAEGSAEAD